jgi:hypothetical protein
VMSLPETHYNGSYSLVQRDETIKICHDLATIPWNRLDNASAKTRGSFDTM